MTGAAGEGSRKPVPIERQCRLFSVQSLQTTTVFAAVLMAQKKIHDQAWKRQQTCPAVRSSAIEALDRNVGHLLAGRKTAQSARPSVAVMTRTPMPVPRSEDCVYVSEQEVHSPSTNRRPMIADKPQYRKAPVTPPRGTCSPVAGEGDLTTGVTSVSTNHYYRTLSETRDEEDEGSVKVDEDDSDDYDYTRFYSGPRSRLSGNTAPADKSGSSPYYRVLDNGSRYVDTTAVTADTGEEDDNAYDYTRFNSAEIGSKPASLRHYRMCDVDGGDASDGSDQDFPYSEPRTMTETEPPRFAAPTLLKSASSPSFSVASAANQANQRPVPKAKLHKYTSASATMKSVNSGGLPQSRKEQGPPSFKPTKLSPGQEVPPVVRKTSPLADRHVGQESFDGEEDVEGEDYTYPTIERKALPYFKPRAVSPRTGHPLTGQVATAAATSLTPQSSVMQRGEQREQSAHANITSDARAYDVDYAHNEALDSVASAPTAHLQSDHIYDSGMPRSKLRKPVIVKKPDPARKLGTKPPLPSKPGKPMTVNSFQSEHDRHEDSDDEDVYYDPPTAFRPETKKNYKILDGQATSWYHGVCSRQDAENLLASHPCGTYLLRDGQKHKGFTLSVSRGAGHCRHFQVYHLDNGTFKLGSFDSCHKNIHQLILFCHQHPINSAGEKLTEPLPLH